MLSLSKSPKFSIFQLECGLGGVSAHEEDIYFSRKIGSTVNRENVISTTRKQVKELYLLNYLNYLVAAILDMLCGHVLHHWTQSFSLWRQHTMDPRQLDREPGDPVSTTKQCVPHSPSVLSFVQQQKLLALPECDQENPHSK